MTKKLILLCVAFVAVLSAVILSAVLTMSAEEVTEYSITFTDTEYSEYLYLYTGLEKDKATEGTEVYVYFDCYDEESEYYNYVLAGIRVNGGELIKAVGANYYASFTMPAENVEIEAILEKTYGITFTGTEYLSFSRSYFYEDEDGNITNVSISGVDRATEGAEVTVWFECNDEESEHYNHVLTGIRVNGGELIEAVEDTHGLAYFTMPAEDVEIEAILEKAYTITFTDTEYSEYIHTRHGIATEGTEVTVWFNCDDEESEYYNYVLAGIRVNGGELIKAEMHDYTDFEMPAEDVEIEVVLEKAYDITSPDYPDLRVSYESANGGWYVCSSAPEGTKIRIRTRSLEIPEEHRVVGAYINGTKYSVDEEGYIYFTMPDEDVEIEFVVSPKRSITVVGEGSEHIRLNVLDNSAFAGTLVNVYYYKSTSRLEEIIVDGETIPANENGDAYFTMPDHDVVVTLVSADKYQITVNLDNASSVILDNLDYIGIACNNFVVEVQNSDTVAAGNTVNIISPIYRVGSDIFGFSAPVISYIYVNGEKITSNSNVFEFTMPNEDVEIVLVTELYKLTTANEDIEFLIEIHEDYWQPTICAKEGSIIAILYNGDEELAGAYVNGEKINADESGNIEFTMPAEDVQVELIFASVYEITVDEDFEYDCNVWIDFWTDNGYNCFVAGQEVELRYFKEAGWVGFTVNGEEIDFTVIEEDDYNITVIFIMPDNNVLIEGIYDDTPYTITVDSDYGVFVPSSALVNEYIFIQAEHVPGYTLSMTLNGIGYDEFTGGDPDGFHMPAENLSIVITYTANDTNPEEITFEADIDALPSVGFGYDYTPDIKLSDSILAAIPEEMRDEIEFIWFASDEAFPTLTFDNYEEFFTLYQMGYDQALSTFVDGYNYGAAFAIVTDKNYVFASDFAIINGVEVPITVLRVDIGVEEIYGTVVFFEFELAELVEKDVSLDLTVKDLPSEGDSVYDSEIDFELPIDADYVVEDFLWLYSSDGEFPEINSFEDFNSLEDFMVEYDAVFVSEGKYAILLLVSVDYGTNITDGTIIFNGKIITARVITQEELEASMMASGNLVYVLVEFEISDDGAIVPAEILGDAPVGDEDNDGDQENIGNNPETGDGNYTSLFVSILTAVMVFGVFVIVMSVKKSKRNRT